MSDPLIASPEPAHPPSRPDRGPWAERVRLTLDRAGVLGDEKRSCAYLGVPAKTLDKWLDGQRKTPTAAAVRLLDVLDMVALMAPDVHAALVPSEN